ncbi:MAG: hypothetical protein Q8M29_15920 [Bacteroidota bacterium]|nr:hypothetical protein [Bacteroidota bacterium]
MRIIKKIAALFLIICYISSCGLKGSGIPAGKEDYIGTWTSDKITLKITAGGRVDYKKQTSEVSSTSVNGPIQKFEGNNFIVGALGINTTFIVTNLPHQEAGVIKMTVDGEELVKQ